MSLRAIALLLSCLLLWGCQAGHRRPASMKGPEVIRWSGEVLVAQDFLVPEGSLLRIEPGTRVLFAPASSAASRRLEHPYFPGNELIVAGSIEAIGTPERPILFQSLDAGAPPGSWGAVNLEENASGLFRYCIFRQADSALHSRSAMVEVSRSFFEHNLVGIRFNRSAILIEENHLYDNEVAIRFHQGFPVICRNRIEKNAKGLFITADPGSYRIFHNDFIASRAYQVILGASVTQDVHLEYNFWGRTQAQEISGEFFDARLDDYLGEVIFEPFSRMPYTESFFP